MKTPYFTISKKKVMEQYSIVSSMSDIVSYSSKTNPLVTSVLEDATDCLFSIHTKNELKNVKDKSRVVFLAQGWTDNSVKELLDFGVKWFIVDNEVDLDVLENVLNSFDGKVNLLLRWKLKENTIRTEKYYVFGMKTDVIVKRVELLRENSKIGKLGIHFHRKTQNLAEWKLLFELENSFSSDFFSKLDIVNIGGGLPSEYANTNVKVINGIIDKIKELKDWLNSKDIRMMIEPGRFIAAPSGELHTRVLCVNENTVIVDASVYNGDMDALIVPVKLKVKGELDRGKAYVIKGVTPCSMDIFRYKVYLSDVAVGDEIVFINAGAYNFNSDFCDLEPVESVVEE